MKRTGIINISIEAFRRGVGSALRNHAADADVKAFMEDYDGNCQRLYGALLDGSWKGLLGYKPLEIENSCGYIFKGSTNQMEYLDDGNGGWIDQDKDLCLTL